MTRAVTAEAELKQLKGQSAKELQAIKDELVDSLEQAQAMAEQRLEQHTEEYRLQVLCCTMTIMESDAHHGASTLARLRRELLLQPCSMRQCAHADAAPQHAQSAEKGSRLKVELRGLRSRIPP